jgi:hypothetical protein
LNRQQTDGIPDNVGELEDYDFPSLLPIDSTSQTPMKANSVFSNIPPDEFNNMGRQESILERPLALYSEENSVLNREDS